MKFTTKNKASIINKIKLLTFAFITTCISLIILKYPDYTAAGIKKGIILCFDKIIPSLFPFMIISSFIIKSNLTDNFTFPLKKIIYKIFRLPPEAVSVIILSLVGGYPIGVYLANEQAERDKLNPDDCKHISAFCVNPSITFCTSYIGSFLLCNRHTGLIIYICVILSSILTGIIYAKFKKMENFTFAKSFDIKKQTSYLSAYNSAVSDSTYTITSICVSVIIFSCILNLIKLLQPSKDLNIIISFFLEITNFAENNYNNVSVSLICAALSFGGICTHFQIMPFLYKLKIRYSFFLIYRIINSFFAYFISEFMFYIFPFTVPTAMNFADKAVLTQSGIPVSVTLIFMAVIIILTDNVREKRKIRI